MKRVILSSLFLVLTLSLSAKFVYFAQGTYKAYYYDTERINVDRNGYVNIWIKEEVNTVIDRSSQYSYAYRLYKVDVYENRTTLLAERWYQYSIGSDKLIKSVDSSSYNWHYASPNSIYEKIVTIAKRFFKNSRRQIIT